MCVDVFVGQEREVPIVAYALQLTQEEKVTEAHQDDQVSTLCEIMTYHTLCEIMTHYRSR